MDKKNDLLGLMYEPYIDIIGAFCVRLWWMDGWMMREGVMGGIIDLLDTYRVVALARCFCGDMIVLHAKDAECWCLGLGLLSRVHNVGEM